MMKRNKSNEGLTNDDELRLYQQLKDENNYDDLDRTDTANLIGSRQSSAKKPVINTYSHVKKITNKNSLINNSNTNLNTNFQNELTLRLKTISSNKEQLEKQQQNQQENQQQKPLVESNSTATTSLSSASSCMSNSDLILSKKEPNQQQQHLPTNNPIKRPIDLEPNNKNYSLLKNSNNQIEAESSNNNSGTLGRQIKPMMNGSVKNGVVYGTTTYKPPILKPKPRGNIYQSSLGGTIGRRLQNGDSLHNQSVEPLLKETSLHTSPSTSVTDVSSNNCTPQHYTSNLVEEISRVNQQQQQHSAKATTTFATTPNGNSIIYSTTKINSNQEVCATMRTFNVNYENSTLNRKAKKPDEEASKVGQQQHQTMAQRTLDRRHIKNSEC